MDDPDDSDLDSDTVANDDDLIDASGMLRLPLFRYRSSNDQLSNTSSSSDSDENQQDEEYYDLDEHTRSLPYEHQYLGELEPVRGRVIMDDNSAQKIPVICLALPFVLVPGQTFPLLINDNSAIDILKYAVEHDHIFSIIPVNMWNYKHSEGKPAAVGTTAEIIACGQTEEGLKIKAIGRQRFEINEVKDELIGDRHVLFAYIRVLPEINLTHVLHDYQLTSLNRFRSSQRLKCLRREACQSPWPFWTHRLYDEQHIMEDLKRKLSSDFRMSKNIRYSKDATALFFQILKNVPIPSKLMREGMTINNSIQRLNWLKQVLKTKSDRLECAACKSVTLGKSSDIFAMSAEGPHGTYTNSHGYVHELITLKNVWNVAVSGTPEIAFSWFPKYAWQFLNCSNCYSDIGWKFVACDENLNPRFFYALRNDATKVKNFRKSNRRGSPHP